MQRPVKQTLRMALVTAVVVGGSLSVLSSTAFAGGSSTQIAPTDGGSTVQVTVSTGSSFGGSPHSSTVVQQSSGSSPCQWVEVPSSFLLGLGLSAPSSSNDGSDLVVDYVSCPTVTDFDEAVGEGGYQIAPTSGFFWYKITSTTVPKPCVSCAVHHALGEASANIPSPAIRTAPDVVGGVSPATVVNLPTWLWISPAVWHSVTASATAGGITADVVAQPVSVTWSLGNGQSLDCNGPGTPYNDNIPLSWQLTNCSYTYTSDFSGAEIMLTATIHWTVTWSATNGVTGSLPPLSSQSTVPLHVEQIESIITTD